MLSKDQIQKEVEVAGFELVSSESYKNLSSLIEVKCKRGHHISTSIEALRASPICHECTRQVVNIKAIPPKKTGRRVVSIDQATNVAGVAVFDDGSLVYAGEVKFHGELGERYKKFALFLLQDVISNWDADQLVFEDIQYQSNPQTYKVLGGLLGVCILAAELHNIPYDITLNKVWQSSFNIKGRERSIQKLNAMKKVQELFGIKVSNDVADAVLLGYHHLLNSGIKLF